METESTSAAVGAGASTSDERARAHAAWREAVAAVLAKSRKVDRSELPADAESLLTATTYEGIRVAPLYVRSDERGEAPPPGTVPYVRGRDLDRDVSTGWFVAETFGTPREDPAETNRQILEALENGVSALRITVGAGGTAAQDLSRALDHVLFELAPVTLDAGAGLSEAFHSLTALLDDRAIDDRAHVTVGLAADPLTAAVTGVAAPSPDELTEVARAATRRPETIRTIMVDGSVFHDLGAADATELGASVAAGVEYMRLLTASGMSAEEALGQIEFRFAASDDQFQTIAKFRAGRLLWARVADVAGSREAGAAPQHAVTSAAMMTQRDPWVNLLRTTLAAFGAGIGGAESVLVRPFDSALRSGATDTRLGLSRRLARNIQLLLLEESHLGRVLDPAGGSWHVESLTDALADTAWEFFQEIEQAGGYRAAAESGLVAERIEGTRAARDADIAHRRTAVTGVNEFPDLQEPALKVFGENSTNRVHRYGTSFERLRDRSDRHLQATGARPQALLVPLGPLAEHNARATFAANLLASGGIEAVNPGELSAAGIAPAVRDTGALPVAVICGTDARYRDEATEAVGELRKAGVTKVVLAGPDKSLPADVGDAAQRPDVFVHTRIDAPATLSDLLDTLGVK